MALDPGTKQRLQASHAYPAVTPGQVTFRHLDAFLRDMEEKASAGQNKPNPIEGKISNANGTAQTVIVGAGTLYRCRVINSDNDPVIVLLSDAGNNIIIGVVYSTGASATGPGGSTVSGMGEADFNGLLDGVGVPFGTDLRVRAFKASDGTTGADNGCTVYPLYGTAL